MDIVQSLGDASSGGKRCGGASTPSFCRAPIHSSPADASHQREHVRIHRRLRDDGRPRRRRRALLRHLPRRRQGLRQGPSRPRSHSWPFFQGVACEASRDPSGEARRRSPSRVRRVVFARSHLSPARARPEDAKRGASASFEIAPTQLCEMKASSTNEIRERV